MTRRRTLWAASLVSLALALSGCPRRVAGLRPDGTEAPPADSIYFVLVDRFANGDRTNDGVIDPSDPAAFHGGDLQGVLNHLDELQALGVRTLWLSPVFKMRTEKLVGF
ncbi:MAG: alpha-amylase family glycosyl hydrolase, partial [Myxococcaceae bacterium]